jgi:lipoprotein-anchoring transpeptidase ErfK/SrfK
MAMQPETLQRTCSRSPLRAETLRKTCSRSPLRAETLRTRMLFCLCAAGALGLARDARSEPLAPPWIAAGTLLPEGTSSARVLKSDQPLFFEPAPNAARRGSAMKDVGLPIFATRVGAGCSGAWLEVGVQAWVCEDAISFSPNAPIDALTRSAVARSDGLPFRYFFIGPDGSFGYRRVEVADVGEPDMQLEPGFAVAIVEERVQGGSRYGRTNGGLWLPLRDVGPAHSSLFHGEEVPKDAAAIPFAWVVADRAKIYGKPAPIAPTGEVRTRLESVPFFEERSTFAGKFTRVGDDAWIASSDLRHPTIAPPPSEVDAELGEKWIDVDLATQTLVAYEGRRAAFTTLVSTGKGKGNAYNATPTGTFRVWVKLLSSNMDNLEDENASRNYRMEDVPWVQYFAKGVGLHGAYWHHSFGHVRSHGCVNLAPLDAERLFWWTSPHLPAGWSAVLPTSHELGTIVRVR